MNKTVHFLSGGPRSGSTVLAAILNQNPLTHVSTTSGLVAVLDVVAVKWHETKTLLVNDPKKEKLIAVLSGIIDSFYKHVDKPIVIDKSRAWPEPIILAALCQILGRQAKIVATVRSIPDCAASCVRVIKPEDLNFFLENDGIIDHLKAAYTALHQGFQALPDSFLFVEYNDLVKDPKQQLDRIHKFLDLPEFEYDFYNIDGASVQENDEEIAGHKGLHDIKSVLKAQHNESSKDVLGHYYYQFRQPEFWKSNPVSDPDIHDLDLQVAASTTGDFVEGWRLAQKMEREEPTNHRAAFNRGWYLLRQGQIQKGYQLLDRGRLAHVFGDQRPDTPVPDWDGKSKGKILLYLEVLDP
jgi:sulfotransferase